VQVYRGEQILRGFDHDVQETLAGEMKKKGIDIRLHLNVIELIRHADGQMTAKLENIIRAYPEQWIWMHRRWRTKPEKE